MRQQYNLNRVARWPYIQLQDGSFYRPLPPTRLNRSQRWRPAKTYQHAREQSPSDRPVR